MKITCVRCSKWITECAKESRLFNKSKCINIPNTLDLNVYKPVNQEVAIKILNINTDKRMILFGAMSSTSDKRKGVRFLIEAIKKLDKNKYVAVIFGNDSERNEVEDYLEIIYFGQLSDDIS